MDIKVKNHWVEVMLIVIYYSKSEMFTYNPVYQDMSPEMRARYSHLEPDGRLFKDGYLGDVSPETVEDLRKSNLLYVTSTGGYRIKQYLDEADGTLVDDIWTDINPENSQSAILTDYPTQKPETLLTESLNSHQTQMILCSIASSAQAQPLPLRKNSVGVGLAQILTKAQFKPQQNVCKA